MADNDGNAFLFSTKRKLENNNVNNVPEHRQKLYKRDTYHIDDGAEETKVPSPNPTPSPNVIKEAHTPHLESFEDDNESAMDLRYERKKIMDNEYGLNLLTNNNDTEIAEKLDFTSNYVSGTQLLLNARIVKFDECNLSKDKDNLINDGVFNLLYEYMFRSQKITGRAGGKVCASFDGFVKSMSPAIRRHNPIFEYPPLYDIFDENGEHVVDFSVFYLNSSLVFRCIAKSSINRSMNFGTQQAMLKGFCTVYVAQQLFKYSKYFQIKIINKTPHHLKSFIDDSKSEMDLRYERRKRMENEYGGNLHNATSINSNNIDKEVSRENVALKGHKSFNLNKNDDDEFDFSFKPHHSMPSPSISHFQPFKLYDDSKALVEDGVFDDLFQRAREDKKSKHQLRFAKVFHDFLRFSNVFRHPANYEYSKHKSELVCNFSLEYNHGNSKVCEIEARLKIGDRGLHEESFIRKKRAIMETFIIKFIMGKLHEFTKKYGNGEGSRLSKTPTIKSNGRACMNGDECFKANCKFEHPSGLNRVGLKETDCKHGWNCKKKNCLYRHPQENSSSFYNLNNKPDDFLSTTIMHHPQDKKPLPFSEFDKKSVTPTGKSLSINTHSSSGSLLKTSSPRNKSTIKKKSESDLTKIKRIHATENVKEELKINWKKHFSKSRENWYYYNKKTKKKWWCEDGFPDGVAYENITEDDVTYKRIYFNIYTQKKYNLESPELQDKAPPKTNSNNQCKMLYFNPYNLNGDAQKLNEDSIFDVLNEVSCDMNYKQPFEILESFTFKCNDVFDPLVTHMETGGDEYLMSFVLLYRHNGNVVLDGQATIARNKLIETKRYYKSLLSGFIAAYILLKLKQLNKNNHIRSEGKLDNGYSLVVDKLREIISIKKVNDSNPSITKKMSSKDLYKLLHRICNRIHRSASPITSLNNFCQKLKHMFSQPEYEFLNQSPRWHITCTLRDIHGNTFCSYTAIDDTNRKHTAASGVLITLNNLFEQEMQKEEEEKEVQMQKHIARMNTNHSIIGNSSSVKKRVSFLNDDGERKPPPTSVMYIKDNYYNLFRKADLSDDSNST